MQAQSAGRRVGRDSAKARVEIGAIQLPFDLKILFACTCLEPGLDGVGDYTRRLALALRALGHECHLLSVADGYVAKPVSCEFLESGKGVKALRLPAASTWPERVRRAQEFCRQADPEWISWQFVPYGFDPRGLSFGLGGRLRAIVGERNSAIMFHEVWIGNARQARLKDKLVGQVQRRIIRDLLQKLSPKVVQTHTPLYLHLLESLGARPLILPLFGNIPLATSPEPGWLERIWPPDAGRPAPLPRESWWVFAMFGSIHPEWDAEDFRRRALAAAAQAGKKCLLISIGRAGVAGEAKLQQLRRESNDSWQVVSLGQQPESQISQCLLAADFGVTSVPPESVFKSGTTVAMIEHGLHVILTRPAAEYGACPREQLTLGMRNVVTDMKLAGLQKTKVGSLLPSVVRQYMASLEKS